MGQTQTGDDTLLAPSVCDMRHSDSQTHYIIWTAQVQILGLHLTLEDLGLELGLGIRFRLVNLLEASGRLH